MAKGGDICTNSLSLVMMQNQNQIQSQYSSTVRSGASAGGRRGGRGSVDAQLYGQRRGGDRGEGTGEYERRTSRGKSKRSTRNKEKEMDEEEEADEDRVEEDEEEEEEEIKENGKDVSSEKVIKSDQKKFRKLSRTFGLSESVFSILCVTAWETEITSTLGSSRKKVAMNRRERTAARNAEGTCLRTFVLPFPLSDVVEGCLLVGGKEKDAFAATTGRRLMKLEILNVMRRS